MMKGEPDILIERCVVCPFHVNLDLDRFVCGVLDGGPRIGPWDRRFPRWCPLLRGPLVMAAERKRLR